MPSIEISQNAFDYLQSKAKPLVDTTVTVFDRIIEGHKGLSSTPPTPTAGMDMHFGVADLPSVKFTAITAASIEGAPLAKKDWNHTLEAVIAECIDKGTGASTVKSVMQAQVMDGQHNENGYRYVSKAGFSFQGLEANRACRNIVLLAEQFSVSVNISVLWQDNDKAAHPNMRARLVFP